MCQYLSVTLKYLEKLTFNTSYDAQSNPESRLISSQTTKYKIKIHIKELFNMPKDLYLCPSDSEIYSALPYSTAMLGRPFSAAVQ